MVRGLQKGKNAFTGNSTQKQPKSEKSDILAILAIFYDFKAILTTFNTI